MRRIHASAWVFCTCAVSALFIAGCDSGESAKTAPDAREELPSPAEYMKDPAFRAALDAQSAERKRLYGARENVRDAMAKLVAAQQATMPSADEAAVKAELEKNPEWVSLQKRHAEAEAAIEENRQQTLRKVRERLAPKKISK